MQRVNYAITFLGFWHCGSGLSSGAIADKVVLKDDDGLPYLPGKSIKGLFRDALSEMPLDLAGIDEKQVLDIFGEVFLDGKTREGTAFFSDAELPAAEKNEIMSEMATYLYRTISSTAISGAGTALEQTLRTTEVCVPLKLEGHIDILDENDRKVIMTGAKWIRHVGMHRNRGLGRCKIEISSNNKI